MVAPQFEQGQQSLPASPFGTWTGIDIGNREDLRIAKMVGEHGTVTLRQGSVIENGKAALSEGPVQRFGSDEIGQQHPGADHREHDHAIVANSDGSRIENIPGSCQKAHLAQLTDRRCGHHSHAACLSRIALTKRQRAALAPSPRADVW